MARGHITNEKPGWRDRATALPNVGRFLQLVWSSSSIMMIATIILRVSRAAMPVVLFWVPKLILDEVVLILRHQKGDMARVWKLVILQFALAALNDMLGRVNTLCENLLGERFANHVNERLIEHASTLDLAHFENPLLYDKLERARNQTSARMSLLTSLLNVSQEAVTLVTLLLGFMVLSRWLFFLLIISTFPAFLYDAYFGALRYSFVFRIAPQKRKLDYLRRLGTTLESAKEIRLLGLGRHLTKLYQRTATDVYDQTKDLAVRRALVGSLISLLSNGGYYAAYILALLRVIAGSISLGTFTFVASSFSRSRSSIERISAGLNGISENSLLLRDLFEFFELRPLIRSRLNALAFPQPVRDGIEFRNVSFAYPGTDRLVLRNVSFRLRPGETMALVGENGSGKTTIVKLLTRLYDPADGQVLLDGIDLREYDLHDLRRQIGIAFQDFLRYEMTVRENVGFGNLERMNDEPRMKKAMEVSRAQSVVARLPGGYQQMLGRRFENGVDLSGGEWQKIALARAYMREAQLMILDEPSASLDARAEYEVFQRFSELMMGRMAVLISHRFVTVRMAGTILVLADGVIEEQGTHAELLACNGRYAELYDLQAAGYR